MVIGFHDENGVRLHTQFQKWRKSNPDGYFLNFKTEKRILLHASDCFHSGGVLWDGRPRAGSRKRVYASLTKDRKVCCTEPVELLSWADNEALEWKSCSHCVDMPLAKDRITEVKYAEYSRSAKSYLESRNANGVGPAPDSLLALEGILKENKVTVRNRSPALRQEAIAKSKGICQACRTDFSQLLDGLGEKVLQVHHRKQLAQSDAPVWNSVADLAVVCANCHLLIHSDIANAIEVESLRRMLAKL